MPFCARPGVIDARKNFRGDQHLALKRDSNGDARQKQFCIRACVK